VPDGAGRSGESDFWKRIRRAADATVDVLESAGETLAAESVRAARREPLQGPEELLVLRSSLIATRPRWESVMSPELAGEIRDVLRLAKPAAIEGE